MNNECFNIYSAGGVGDALLVMLKIRQIKQKNGIYSNYYWTHAERHECHKWAITEIMKTTIDKGFYQCHIREDADKFIKDQCKINNGTFIDANIYSVENPYLDYKIGEKFIVQNPGSNNNGHIVINVSAGRMFDSTKRTIGIKLINKIAKRFNDRKIILIAPEYVEYEEKPYNNVQNITGKTDTIIDALSYINKCSLFVGNDGVCAYYAMMNRKPSIVNYHIDNLINRYYNKNWAMHSIAIIGVGNRLDDLNIEHPETQALLDIAENYNG